MTNMGCVFMFVRKRGGLFWDKQNLPREKFSDSKNQAMTDSIFRRKTRPLSPNVTLVRFFNNDVITYKPKISIMTRHDVINLETLIMTRHDVINLQTLIMTS